MHMNTLKLEIRKKIANMDHYGFEKLLGELINMYLSTHPKETREKLYYRLRDGITNIISWYEGGRK